MQSPQEARSHPMKNWKFVLLTQATTRPPLRRQSPALLQTHQLWSFKGQDKEEPVPSGCMCINSLHFTSHASARCRAGPVSHSTKQTSCDAGVATSLNPSHSKVSTTKLSEQKRDRSLSLAGDPFCIIHLEFASVVQSLNEQSPNDSCQRQPLPQHLL